MTPASFPRDARFRLLHFGRKKRAADFAIALLRTPSPSPPNHPQHTRTMSATASSAMLSARPVMGGKRVNAKSVR